MSQDADFSEDKYLVDQCRKGDSAAWERLWSYRPCLVRFAYWLQGGQAILGVTPEGTVQDVFLRLCKHDYRLLRSYNYQRDSLRCFLMRLVRRQVRALRARARRRLPVISLTDQDQIDPGASGGVVEAAFHECVANLGPAERELLAEEMRPRQPSEQQPARSDRERKAKERLIAKVRDALDQDSN